MRNVEFAADPPKDFPADQERFRNGTPIKVPTFSWEMGRFCGRVGPAVYRKSVSLGRPSWQGKRVKSLAEAVYSRGQVLVLMAGRCWNPHEGGFTPFELDITDAVKPDAKNEILVLVEVRTMAWAIWTTPATSPISSWREYGSRSRFSPLPRRSFLIWQ